MDHTQIMTASSAEVEKTIGKIRVINLDRSTDRLASFHAHNPHMEIARFPAIEGQKLDREALIQEGKITHDLPYTMGGIGNAFSHMTQWREAATQNVPVTVLEDDAVICANFATEAARIIASLGADWDIVLWGHNYDTVMFCDLFPGISPAVLLFDQGLMRQALPGFHQREVESKAYRLHRLLGVPAYTVSPGGAARLLEFCLPLRPCDVHFPLLGLRPNFSIDFIMNAIFQSIGAYVAVPSLALTANDWTVSTVQDVTNPLGPARPSN